MRLCHTMIISAVLLAMCAQPSQGVLVPKQSSGDPRIHVIDYDPAEVVVLRGTLGYQTLLEFAPDEHIENVAVGDSMGWQVTPNRKGDLLFVKPMSEVPITNMTVVTNLRHYLFELRVQPRSDDKSILYTLRFQYPQAAVAMPVAAPPPAPEQQPLVVNAAYSYEGTTKNVPTRIFDDGHVTYFQFRDGDAYPAIFSVDADKGEVVVNSYMRTGFVAVDTIARGFVLRQGSEVGHIYNEGFKVSETQLQSPKPRAKRCWMGILCL